MSTHYYEPVCPDCGEAVYRCAQAPIISIVTEGVVYDDGYADVYDEDCSEIVYDCMEYTGYECPSCGWEDVSLPLPNTRLAD